MSLYVANLNTVGHLINILQEAQSCKKLLVSIKILHVQITISLCPATGNFLKFFLFKDGFKNYFHYEMCDRISTSFRDMTYHIPRFHKCSQFIELQI